MVVPLEIVLPSIIQKEVPALQPIAIVLPLLPVVPGQMLPVAIQPIAIAIDLLPGALTKEPVLLPLELILPPLIPGELPIVMPIEVLLPQLHPGEDQLTEIAIEIILPPLLPGAAPVVVPIAIQIPKPAAAKEAAAVSVGSAGSAPVILPIGIVLPSQLCKPGSEQPAAIKPISILLPALPLTGDAAPLVLPIEVFVPGPDGQPIKMPIAIELPLLELGDVPMVLPIEIQLPGLTPGGAPVILPIEVVIPPMISHRERISSQEGKKSGSIDGLGRSGSLASSISSLSSQNSAALGPAPLRRVYGVATTALQRQASDAAHLVPSILL